MLPPLFFTVRLPTLLAIFWRTHFDSRRIVGTSRKEPLSFIIFRLDSLGDVVMTTPLFQALKKARPGSRCTVVVQQGYKSLLVTDPHIDEVLTLPRIGPAWLPQGIARLLSAVAFYWTRLRKRHFDFAISPRWDLDEHLATFLCSLTHASSRIGYSDSSTPKKQRLNRGFDRAFSVCLQSRSVKHEVLRNLAIAELLGGTSSGAKPEVYLTERDRRTADKLLARVGMSGKLIALGIGAQSPGRRWPLKRYAATVSQLEKENDVQTVIVCSADERIEAKKLARQLRRPPMMLCGAPLREVCAVLERCDLFIGNDSGCAHLAAAVDCRTIVISRHPREGAAKHFNSPLRFAPYCAHSRVLQPATGLDECREACSVTQPHCITRVSVEEVAAASREMLKTARRVTGSPQIAMDQRAQRLLQAHSADAVKRALDALRAGPPVVSV